MKITKIDTHLRSSNKAKISEGPYGMIAINVNGKSILVNANGIFDKYGAHIRTSEAKDILGL
jgi:hypothetical protein